MSQKNNKTALVCLVPVIHTKYLDLFKKYPNNLYILGASLLKKWPEFNKLERDLRRIDPYSMADFVKNSNIVKNVKVLELENLNELKNYKIVLPTEDISEWLHDNYFKKNEVVFEDTFLRWNKLVSTQELEVSPDRKITEDEFHQEMILKTDELAKKSANWWRQLGVLLVKDKEIICEAFNKHVPTQENISVYGDLRMCFDAGEHHELSNSIHGEASLIAKCAKKGIVVEDSDLYVTVFPCPTCAKLIAESGIKRVFYKSGYSLSDAEDILKANEVELVLVNLSS
jgi:dCMP deaminase